MVPAAHPHDPTAGCGRQITVKQAQPFIEAVWSPDRWHRGAPKAATVTAYQHMLLCASPGNRKAIKRSWREHRRRFYRHRSYKLRWGDCSTSGPVPDCIRGAALTYGADEAWMRRVSWCESRWDRFAVNPSGSTGLFQFKRSTWATTPYAAKSIWSVKWQSLAAAWMNVQGRSGEWVCV